MLPLFSLGALYDYGTLASLLEASWEGHLPMGVRWEMTFGGTLIREELG